MKKSKAFTFKPNAGTLSAIITQCGVCVPFDPRVPRLAHPKVINFNALWDTGATGSVISPNVVSKLGLRPIGETILIHANGRGVVNKHKINLILPNQVGFSFVTVLESNLHGFDILIGMDIIGSSDFAISHVNGHTMFSFGFPSVHAVDYLSR